MLAVVRQTTEKRNAFAAYCWRRAININYKWDTHRLWSTNATWEKQSLSKRLFNVIITTHSRYRTRWYNESCTLNHIDHNTENHGLVTDVHTQGRPIKGHCCRCNYGTICSISRDPLTRHQFLPVSHRIQSSVFTCPPASYCVLLRRDARCREMPDDNIVT